MLLCVAAMLLGACKTATPPTSFGVNLTVDARPITNRDGATTLRVDVSGGEMFHRDFDVAALVKDTGLFHTHYVPGITMGTLIFDVQLLAADNTVRGKAAPSDVTLVPGGATDITIALTDGPMLDLGMEALPAECTNQTIDPGETDVDCSCTCPRCEPGRACQTDGDCATSTCINTRCELATNPPTWVDVTSLPGARATAVGGARDDGTIWVIGGYTSAIQASTLFYSMKSNDWTAGPPLAEPRMQAASVVASDQFFVIGGLTPIGGGMTDALATIAHGGGFGALAWNTLTRSLSSKRHLLGAALGSDGLVYVAGGLPAAAMPPIDDFVSFNPLQDGTDAPTVLAKLPSARSQLGLAGDLGGRIVAVGGTGADNLATAATDIFKIATAAWTPGPALMVPRRNAGTILGPDGRIYTIGGNDDGAIASVEALSHDATYWSPVAPLASARTQVAVARGWDGRIYAIGGQVGASAATLAPTAIVQAYGPRISCGPAMGVAATVIAISGSNFAKSAKVTLTFSDSGAGVATQIGMTDADGKISPSFVWTVPAQLAPGEYFFTAVDDKSRYPVRTRFTVQ